MNELIEIILNTRDFCGNEKEAISDWESENGKLSAHQMASVLLEVSQEWKLSQLSANVKQALTDAERIKAFADIESAI
jgi:hypothetical protein